MKAKAPNVVYALAVMSGCLVWYILIIVNVAITYMNDVSEKIPIPLRETRLPSNLRYNYEGWDYSQTVVGYIIQ